MKTRYGPKYENPGIFFGATDSPKYLPNHYPWLPLKDDYILLNFTNSECWCLNNQRQKKSSTLQIGRVHILRHHVNDREVTAMSTLPGGLLLFGLCVLGVAVATAVYDTWWLRRKTEEAAEETEKAVDRQNSLPRAA